MSLVKGDLTVGHCEFEGLRKKERKGFSLHPPQSRGPLLTKAQAPERGPQCQPSWREPVNGEELKSFMGTGEGFLSTEKKGLSTLGRAQGWAGGFPGLSSSDPQEEGCPSALWNPKPAQVSWAWGALQTHAP